MKFILAAASEKQQQQQETFHFPKFAPDVFAHEKWLFLLVM